MARVVIPVKAGIQEGGAMGRGRYRFLLIG